MVMEMEVGKLCKIVYYDGAISKQNIRSIKGVFVKQDSNFTTIRTLQGELSIHNNNILKICSVNEEDRYA